MRAVGINKYGGLEVLEKLEIPDPKPGKGEVVVRQSHTSVNRLDILVREGYHGLQLPMPHIPGADVSGHIESVGEGVEGFSVEDNVIANTVFGCGKCVRCLAGEENLCPEWKTIGMHIDGSYAELVKLPASVLLSPPIGFSTVEMATLPLSLSASWRAISVLGNAKQGETIVIRGASGNVGIFSVQIAKKLGLNVIALSRGETKKEQLTKLGADHVLDSSKNPQDLTKEIFEITQNKGADIVVETSGGTLGNSIGFTAHGGKVVVFGTIAGIESNVKIPPLYLRSVEVRGTHNATKKEFSEALAFAGRTGIKPIIAKQMPLEEAAAAQASLLSAENFGKIVLTIQD